MVVRPYRIGTGALGLVLIALAGSALQARDTLAVFGRWGAFRDGGDVRCFAIAKPVGPDQAKNQWAPFAAIGYWPKQGVRGQINIRLGRALAPGASATVDIAGKRFTLAGRGPDVWAKDQRNDAAIIAALRAGGTMSVHGRAATGGTMTDHYELRGAATAIDAAALGCARTG